MLRSQGDCVPTLSPSSQGRCGGHMGSIQSMVLPEQQGLWVVGRGIFSPPAAPACLGYQMQAGRGRRGTGAENELKVKWRGEGKEEEVVGRGGRVSPMRVENRSLSTLLSPFPHANHRGSLSSGYL